MTEQQNSQRPDDEGFDADAANEGGAGEQRDTRGFESPARSEHAMAVSELVDLWGTRQPEPSTRGGWAADVVRLPFFDDGFATVIVVMDTRTRLILSWNVVYLNDGDDVRVDDVVTDADPDLAWTAVSS